MRITSTGADVRRGLALTGRHQYDKGLAATVGKEALQNALDATHGVSVPRIEVGSTGDVFMIADNGAGMTPEEVVCVFLRGFTSGKEGGKSAGSFGLAKIALLAGPRRFRLETVCMGQRTVVTGTEGQWYDYAQAGEFEVEPMHGVPVALPGGLEMTVDASDAPTGTVYSAECEQALAAEIVAKNSLAVLRRPEIEAVLCDPASMTERGIESGPVAMACRDNPELMVVRRTETVPGAVIELYYDPAGELRRCWSVPVTSHGLPQFLQSIQLDAKLPQSMSVEVRPTVGTDDEAYPYALSRDALKGAAKAAFEVWIRDLADEAKALETRLLREIRTGAKRLRGTTLRFVDMTGSVPDSIRDEIIASAPLADYARLLARAYSKAAERLGEPYILDSFAGLAFGGGFIGTRVGGRHGGGEVFHDPWQLCQHTQSAMDHAAGAVGTFVHELAHAENHSEGESHAVAMSAIVGRVLPEAAALHRGILRCFQKYSGFGAWLTSTAERLEPFRNTGRVEEFLEASRKATT